MDFPLNNVDFITTETARDLHARSAVEPQNKNKAFLDDCEDNETGRQEGGDRDTDV